MNAFSALLLGFPFYLAVNGKLSGYVALAKPSAPASNGTGEPVASASSASENPVQPDKSADGASSASGSSNADLLGNAATFAEIAGLFVS